MATRKLSPLQIAYRKFFLEKLEKFGVKSPAHLPYEEKRKFFIEIREEWKVKKKEFVKQKNRINQPSQDFNSKVSRTTSSKVRQYAPKRKIQRTRAPAHRMHEPEPDDYEQKVIDSKPNPDQTEDLRIKYKPSHFFRQGEYYRYPVVKMPEQGSLLKLPRDGRSDLRGYKEREFYNAICSSLPEVNTVTENHLTIPFHNRPYEPDITLVDKSVNLYVDIEIDEPYDGYYRFPTHEVEKDEIRDRFFTESGWIVIRFTEKQVHEQEYECISLIKNVLDAIYKQEKPSRRICDEEPQWDYQQSVRWQKEHYREKYLGIEKFNKRNSKVDVSIDNHDLDTIEKVLNRTKLKSKVQKDGAIAIDPVEHVYISSSDDTGNAKYISATTLIDRFFPFDEERYIKRKAQKENRTYNEVLEEYIQIREEAAEMGTYLHEQIENFLKGKEYDDQLEEFKLFQKFYKNIIQPKEFEFVEAEKKILLEDYNIAGTVDAIFKKPGKKEYIVLDWKRSKKVTIDGYPRKYGFGFALSELSHLDNSSYYKYSLQQNLYKYILERDYGIKISSMKLIVLHSMFNNYQIVPVKEMNKEIIVILKSLKHKI